MAPSLGTMQGSGANNYLLFDLGLMSLRGQTSQVMRSWTQEWPRQERCRMEAGGEDRDGRNQMRVRSVQVYRAGRVDRGAGA